MNFDKLVLRPQNNNTFRFEITIIPEEGESIRPIQLDHNPADIPIEWELLLAALRDVVTKG